MSHSTAPSHFRHTRAVSTGGGQQCPPDLDRSAARPRRCCWPSWRWDSSPAGARALPAEPERRRVGGRPATRGRSSSSSPTAPRRKPGFARPTEAYNRQGRKTRKGEEDRGDRRSDGLGRGDRGASRGHARGRTSRARPRAPSSLLGNAQSRARTGKDLIGPTENLVLSPVVIAMWKPMAEALGWGRKAVGWSGRPRLARDPRGWGERRAGPSRGASSFGHTHPEAQQQRPASRCSPRRTPPPGSRAG